MTSHFDRRMTSKEIILEYLSSCTLWKTYYNLSHLQKYYPTLTACNFDDFTPGSKIKTKYLRIYEAFMVLSCTSIREGKLFDNVNQIVLNDEDTVCWKNFILEVFYVFKLVFPAALYFFSNTKYDTIIKNARKLVLMEYSQVLSKDFHLGQYNLGKVWQMKVKYLKNEINLDTLRAVNIINNQKIIQRTFTDRRTLFVNYEDVDHIITIIYTNYSYLLKHRRFLICSEKTANNKFENVFKLRFIASFKSKRYLGRFKIEKHVPLYLLFKKEDDLISLIHIHNAYLREEGCVGLKEIPIPSSKRINTYSEGDVENLYHRLCRVENLPDATPHFHEKMNVQKLKEYIERTGFASVYKLKKHNTLTYVKNRVVHLTSTFKVPIRKKYFFEKKGRKVAKIEKMTRTLTITRYKSNLGNENTVSFNVNYQGPISTMQLTLSRFINENLDNGCKFTKPIWVSNVCTTSDTIHSGILNTHVYRKECFRNHDQLTYPMMNFPAAVTLITDTDKKRANSVINNRTSINTCRMFGEELKSSLAKCVEFIRSCSEIDDDLVRIFYLIESNACELLPRNLVLLIHLLYLHKEVYGYSSNDIVNFFKDRVLCSRMITSSNRGFSTFHLYSRKYKSDAIDNISIKSLKYMKQLPPLIRRNECYKKYRQFFGDVGSFTRNMFKQRGRNSSLIDLILNSKDDFFFSPKCFKLLSRLKEKYKTQPSTTEAINLLMRLQKKVYL